MRQAFAPVARAGVEYCGPGEVADHFLPGDFILTHGSAWTSRLIRFGQAVRFVGDDRKYARWNHAAMIVSANGNLIEALGGGVEETNLAKYEGTEYHLVRVMASSEDRDEVVAFAQWCRGQPYGYITIVSIGLSLLTGAKFTFGFDGQSICSGLVARALERTRAIFNRTPSHIMPADLAKFFQVEPPPPESPKGEVP
jgi:uncharacterized protein YycO